MRILLVLALLLAAPLAAAEPAETIRACSGVGCAIARDTDDDGEYDWANGAFVAGEQVTLNANANRSVYWWHVDVTTEELGGHEVEDVVDGSGAEEALDEHGVETRHATVALTSETNLTARDASSPIGFRASDSLLFISTGDHETGEQEPLVERTFRANDTNGDDVPDAFEGLP